jgi:serine/threonine-protein kinase
VSLPPSSLAPARTLGRYALFEAIASGGMATVHIARLMGPVGFARTVAIKRLHAHLAKDLEFRSMFVDEARLAARIQHPNVVPTLDVVHEHGELFLVMEYVAGEALARLPYRRAEGGEPVAPAIASAIISGVLHGLHAAHEARNERGESLGIVHRDVSPQNILVGADGVSRVLDFGVAKAIGRLQTTRDGEIKGKIAYMAPEQLRGRDASRQSDVYAAAVVLWEMLAGRRLHSGTDETEVVEQVLIGLVDPPSKYAAGIPAALDDLVMRGLDLAPDRRFATAREMALALEKCAPPSFASDVSTWLEAKAGDALAQRAARVAAAESREIDDAPTAVDALAGSHPQRRRRAFRATLIVAVSVALGAFAIRASSDPPESTTAAATRASPVASNDPALAPSVESTTHGAAAPSSAVPSTATAGGTARVSRPHTSPAPRRPTAAAEDCRVPYTFDASGHKVYKRSCL